MAPLFEVLLPRHRHRHHEQANYRGPSLSASSKNSDIFITAVVKPRHAQKDLSTAVLPQGWHPAHHQSSARPVGLQRSERRGCSQTDVREMAAAFFCGKGKDYEDSNCFKAVSDAETECIKLARERKWTLEEEQACYHKLFKKATDEQPQPLSQGYHDLLDFWENRCCEKETVETKCKSYNPEGKCEIYEYVGPHLS